VEVFSAATMERHFFRWFADVGGCQNQTVLMEISLAALGVLSGLIQIHKRLLIECSAIVWLFSDMAGPLLPQAHVGGCVKVFTDQNYLLEVDNPSKFNNGKIREITRSDTEKKTHRCIECWRADVNGSSHVPKQRAVPDLDLAHKSLTDSDPTTLLLHCIDIDARITTPFDQISLDGLIFDIEEIPQEMLITYGRSAPVLQWLGGVEVVRLSTNLVLKSGEGVLASEGETMRHVLKKLFRSVVP
jgi:hypothetical protein